MFKRLVASVVCIAFSLSNLQYLQAQDFNVNQLPVPGTMVGISAPFAPLALKGLIVDPQKPLDFQFIVDTGLGSLDSASVKDQVNQLVRYFLAGLTIPEGDLWVNLSPYEKNRIIPGALGETDLGRDLLAQDYILKQLTASLIYPEKELGQEFWNRVYAKAREQFGTTDIPVNTFNKVWILPKEAQIFENGNAAYVTGSTLKVMLDEDYRALQRHTNASLSSSPDAFVTDPDKAHALGSQIVRQIILPEIEKEVNTGRNFAPLRQIYQALILAKWYKETIQNGLLETVYTDKRKISGVDLNDRTVKDRIYQRYLSAYKKGAFNYIKENQTPDGQVVPRKYFSGGTVFAGYEIRKDGDAAMVSQGIKGVLLALTVTLLVSAPSVTLNAQHEGDDRGLEETIMELYDHNNSGADIKPDLDRLVQLNDQRAVDPIKSLWDGTRLNSLFESRILNGGKIYAWLEKKGYVNYGKAADFFLRIGTSLDIDYGRLEKDFKNDPPQGVTVEFSTVKSILIEYENHSYVYPYMSQSDKNIDKIVDALQKLGVGWYGRLNSYGQDYLWLAAFILAGLIVLGGSEGIKYTSKRKKAKELTLQHLEQHDYEAIIGTMQNYPFGYDVGYESILKGLGYDVVRAKSSRSVIGIKRLSDGTVILRHSKNRILDLRETDQSQDQAMLGLQWILTRYSGNGDYLGLKGTIKLKEYLSFQSSDFLAQLLKHRDRNVRWYAADELANRSDPRAIDPLLGRIKVDVPGTAPDYHSQEAERELGIIINDLKEKGGYSGPQASTLIENIKDEIEKAGIPRKVKRQQENKRRAEAENGGIDLNQIYVKHTGKAIKVQLDPAQLKGLEEGRFEGFTPVIINMTRISSPFQLLGVNTAQDPPMRDRA